MSWKNYLAINFRGLLEIIYKVVTYNISLLRWGYINDIFSHAVHDTIKFYNWFPPTPVEFIIGFMIFFPSLSLFCNRKMIKFMKKIAWNKKAKIIIPELIYSVLAFEQNLNFFSLLMYLYFYLFIYILYYLGWVFSLRDSLRINNRQPLVKIKIN